MGRSNGGEDQRRRWQRLIREQQQSGLSVREFCEIRGIAGSTFYLWKKRLVQPDPQRVEAGPLFVPVEVTAAATGDLSRLTHAEQTAAIEIVFSSGLAVRVSAGFDRHVLADVLDLLEQRR